MERLGLPEAAVEHVLEEIEGAVPSWAKFVEVSFLSDKSKARYLELVGERLQVFGLSF